MNWKKNKTVEIIKNKLRDRIKAEVKRTNMAHTELAEKANIDRRKIGQVISGTETCSIDKLIAVLEILGVDCTLDVKLNNERLETLSEKNKIKIFRDFNFNEDSYVYYLNVKYKGKSIPVASCMIHIAREHDMLHYHGKDLFFEHAILPLLISDKMRADNTKKEIQVHNLVGGEILWNKKIKHLETWIKNS